MDIIEAIKERRSVRSFNGQHLSSDQTFRLRDAVDRATSPFGGSVSIRLESFDLKGPFKPSTYRMISGAADYFLIGASRDKASALSVGYRFEQVVLKAWQMGLGTCWIAATFKDTDFARGQAWPDGEELMIISPVGVAAKPTVREKITRLAVRSKNRKSFESMFFNGDFDTPLHPDGPFGEALAMMRLAPSSTNSQPWRALVSGDTVTFYYKPKSALSILDCGIGICHFDLTERSRGKSGNFFEDGNAPSPPDDWVYLISYRSTP